MTKFETVVSYLTLFVLVMIPGSALIGYCLKPYFDIPTKEIFLPGVGAVFPIFLAMLFVFDEAIAKNPVFKFIGYVFERCGNVLKFSILMICTVSIFLSIPVLIILKLWLYPDIEWMIIWMSPFLSLVSALIVSILISSDL